MPTVSRSARIPLPTGAGFGIALGLAAVSYGHILDFAQGAGAQLWESIIIAATVDGLIIMALSVIGHARRYGVKPPKIAKVALLTGVVATGGANLHHGLSYGWEGVAMAVWVPLVAELAYLLAMAALRIGQEAAATGDRRPVICGHTVPVPAVMSRVAARRPAAEEQAAGRAAAADTRPVICGALVSADTLTERLTVAEEGPDTRPVICGHTVPVPAVMSRVAARRPAAEEQAAGRAAAADTRPVICGALVSADTLTERLTVAEEGPDTRPVICGQVVPVAALSERLVDDRPVICTAVVTVAEVLARTAVAAPEEDGREHEATSARRPAAVRRPVTVATIGAREEVVMEWLTDPAAPDTRMATAKGADVAALLAASGLGRVSERTGRRILATVRAAMGEHELAAA
jgi:hypothetical protein